MSAVSVKETISATTQRSKGASARRQARAKVRATKIVPSETAETLSEAERTQLVLDYRLKARKLSRSILRKWHARLDNQEVDSIVDLSLCEAVKRYNPTKGASFMTFMFFHLRGNLIRAVAGAVQAQAFPAFDDEIDGFSPQSEMSGHTSSKSGVKGPSLSDVTVALYGNDDLLPDAALEKKELAGLSRQACEALDPLEQEVIHRLFFKEQQLLDIADALGYSRCHISRVKKKALQVLKDELQTVLESGDTKSTPRGSEEQTSRRSYGSVRCGTRVRSKERRMTRRRRPRTKKASAALLAASS